ncbi:MAG: efflux transporter outer membrane subunit [Pseudomonadota bacterium]
MFALPLIYLVLRPDARRRLHKAGVLVASVFIPGGCALQAPYTTPEMASPKAWSVNSGPALAATADTPNAHPEPLWWLALGDAAINALTESACADSPSLTQAVARIDEARATLGLNRAAQTPTIGINASLSRAQSQNTSPQSSGATQLSRSTTVGPSLSWEIDLFGRVRQSVEAAQSRLDARTADAVSAHLALVSDIANNVLSLRACENSRRVLVDDIASREKTLELTRLRLKTGFASPVDEARAESGIASIHTNLASQEEQCARLVNALVALSGVEAQTVRDWVGISGSIPATGPVFMPQAPAAAPQLPATLLARHPSVRSTEREVAAAWAEIGVARANRLPQLNLAAALTGQWISAAGSSLSFTTWSLGPSLAGTLFDGGAGASNVSAAEARYLRAMASMQSTLRSTVQEVENALAAQASAQARSASTLEGVKAARTTLAATQAQWEAGTVSLFELEDSRRQFASAQDAEISARRDQAQAWVALVKATGAYITLSPENPHHE